VQGALPTSPRRGRHTQAVCGFQMLGVEAHSSLPHAISPRPAAIVDYRTQKINFSTIVAGQAVGIKEVHDDIWLVSFMGYDLGYFDLETRVLEPRCGRDPC
jgi:hypothetical protein